MPRVSKSAPKSKKKAAMNDVMKRFGKGELHSGSKAGPKVKSRAQAVAIGMSESGQAKGKGKSSYQKSVLAKGKRSRNKGRT